MDTIRSQFEFYEQIWKSGINLIKIQAKIGYHLQMFALNEINKFITKLPDPCKKRLIEMIGGSKAAKANLTYENRECSKEELFIFINKFYNIVREDDSKGNATPLLGSKYQMLYDAIYSIKQFDPVIPEQYIQYAQLSKQRAQELVQKIQITIENSNTNQSYHRRKTSNVPVRYNNPPPQNQYCQTSPSSARYPPPQMQPPTQPVVFNYPEATSPNSIARSKTFSSNYNPYANNNNGYHSTVPNSARYGDYRNSMPMQSTPPKMVVTAFTESDPDNPKTFVNSKSTRENVMNNSDNHFEANMKKYAELIKSNNINAILEIQNGRIDTGIQLLKNSLNFTMN